MTIESLVFLLYNLSFGENTITVDNNGEIEVKRMRKRQYDEWEDEFSEVESVEYDFIEQLCDTIGNCDVEVLLETFQAHKENDNVEMEKKLVIYCGEENIITISRCFIKDDEDTEFEMRFIIHQKEIV